LKPACSTCVNSSVPLKGITRKKAAVWKLERAAQRIVDCISSSVSLGKPSMNAPCTITPCLAMKSTMRSTLSILRCFFITFWMRGLAD
jgi:hypothetical protein